MRCVKIGQHLPVATALNSPYGYFWSRLHCHYYCEPNTTQRDTDWLTAHRLTSCCHFGPYALKNKAGDSFVPQFNLSQPVKSLKDTKCIFTVQNNQRLASKQHTNIQSRSRNNLLPFLLDIKKHFTFIFIKKYILPLWQFNYLGVCFFFFHFHIMLLSLHCFEWGTNQNSNSYTLKIMLALKVHSFFCLFMEARLTVQKVQKTFQNYDGIVMAKKMFWVNYSLRAGGQSG